MKVAFLVAATAAAVVADCGEASTPCQCSQQEGCGWSTGRHSCVSENLSVTDCHECPAMAQCVAYEAQYPWTHQGLEVDPYKEQMYMSRFRDQGNAPQKMSYFRGYSQTLDPWSNFMLQGMTGLGKFGTPILADENGVAFSAAADENARMIACSDAAGVYAGENDFSDGSSAAAIAACMLRQSFNSVPTYDNNNYMMFNSMLDMNTQQQVNPMMFMKPEIWDNVNFPLMLSMSRGDQIGFIGR